MLDVKCLGQKEVWGGIKAHGGGVAQVQSAQAGNLHVIEKMLKRLIILKCNVPYLSAQVLAFLYAHGGSVKLLATMDDIGRLLQV